MPERSLVYGVGINDADYPIMKVQRYTVEGKRKTRVLWRCEFHSLWRELLRRGYSEKEKQRHGGYTNSEVQSGWHKFSSFKEWMVKQNHQGLSLDKDILLKGNKIYGPELCCFVPAYVNTCLVLSDSIRGGLPVGVSISKAYVEAGRRNIYNAAIKNKRADSYKQKNLGNFETAYEAHDAWRTEKIKILEKVIEDYAKEICFRTDVADALSKRVWQMRLDQLNRVETVSI